ncbi:DUF116 domain-containing protein [Candidatus Parcubacteria bacterium]|nr:DUF116 domain-containing protein [Candidatus Parcubacteria bacterium]
MAYNFNFDLNKLPKEFFKILAEISEKRKLHRKLGKASRELVSKFKINEILGIQVDDAIFIVEDLAGIYITNLMEKENFFKAKQKILLLPHCCRKYMDSRCKATFNKKFSAYFCNHCSKNCLASRATELAKSRGYKSFILPGGSAMKKILTYTDCDAIIGVACVQEIRIGIEYIKSQNKKISILGIPLTKNGCSNTKFNLKSLEEMLI